MQRKLHCTFRLNEQNYYFEGGLIDYFYTLVCIRIHTKCIVDAKRVLGLYDKVLGNNLIILDRAPRNYFGR